MIVESLFVRIKLEGESEASQTNQSMHYHLIGICGTAMASLAGIFQAQERKFLL